MRSCPPHSSPSASVSSVLTVADLTLVRLNPSLATKLAVSLAVVLLHTTMAMAQQSSVSEPASSSPTQVSTATNRQQLLFVNPIVGHDVTGDGSQRSPFRTITHVLQRAEPNTVIMLAAGTYSAETGEVFPLQLKPDITIQGDPSTQGRGITIRGGGAFTSADSIEQNATILAADRSQLIGVTVSNPNAQGYGLWSESSTALIANNTFTSRQSQAISTSGDRLAAIQNNRFARSRAAETTSASQSGASQSGASESSSAPPRSSQAGVQTVQQSAAITELPPTAPAIATSATPTITTPPPLVSRPPSSPARPPVTQIASAGNWQSLRYATPITTSPSQSDRQISAPPPVVSPEASAAAGEIVPIAAPASTVSTPSSTTTLATTTRSRSISSTPAVQIAVMPPVQSTRSNRASSSRETPSRENRSIPAQAATRTVAPVPSPAANSVTAPAIAISVPPPVTTAQPAVQPFTQPAAQSQRSSRSNPASSVQPTSTQPPALTPIAATTAIEIPVPPPETTPNAMLAYAAPSTGSAQIVSAQAFSAPIEIPVPLPESSAIPPTLAPSQAISPPKVNATVTAAATGDLLPVPTGDIPIGNVGDMPRISVAGTPSPWGNGAQLVSSYARASLRYRVVVDASSERTQSLVQSIVPDAFLTSIGGQSLMQVGAFSDRINAEQAVQRLTQNGLVAVIQEIE